MSSLLPPARLSWHRDQPDYRDYTPEHEAVMEMFRRLKRPTGPDGEPPAEVDLRDFFPALDGPKALPISTSHACVALVEYFDRRARGKITPRSSLFLHQMARRLARPFGHPGTDIRTTLKALVRFGLPPERHWPSEPSYFNEEPDAFLCWFGTPLRSLRYLRLDARNSRGNQTLETVRAFLAAGFPCVFGFSAPEATADDSDVPYNPVFESVREGHAAVAVGYDDRRLTVTRGALLVRCSVGASWEMPGYRWLPYRYVEEQLAVDFWTVLRSDWLDSGEFRLPRLGSVGEDEP